jgi:hypothetical protein
MRRKIIFLLVITFLLIVGCVAAVNNTAIITEWTENAISFNYELNETDCAAVCFVKIFHESDGYMVVFFDWDISGTNKGTITTSPSKSNMDFNGHRWFMGIYRRSYEESNLKDTMPQELLFKTTSENIILTTMTTTTNIIPVLQASIDPVNNTTVQSSSIWDTLFGWI